MTSDTAAPRSLGGDYWRFWTASAFSNLGDGIRLGALPLLALALTDDARLIGGVVAVTTLPWFLFGPIGGVIVDRGNRRTLMVAGQVARAALVALLVGLIAAEQATIWWVYVVAFGLGCGEIIVDSSSQAAIPQLVRPDQLDRANAHLIAAVTVLDQVAGVTLGAVLFSVSTGLPFVVDAATFVVGAALLLAVRRPLQGARTATSSVRADIGEGFRFLLGHELLRGLTGAVAMTNLAATTASGVFVILIVDELRAPEATYGVVLGVGAVGGIVGSLIAGRLVDVVGRSRLLRSLPAALVTGFVTNALAPAAWVVGISFFVVSFAIVVFNVPGRALRQAVTPEHLLGRVVATFRMVGMGVVPVGAFLGGVITEASNVRVANWAAAAGMLIAWALMVNALRHLPPDEEQQQPR